MIYILVIVLLLLLILRYDINSKTRFREESYMVMLLIFVLMAGLRWRLMVDTPAYLYDFYHKYPTIVDFSFDDYPLNKDPFYALLNSIIKSADGRFYWLQLIEASFVNVLVFRYIARYCKYIFTSIFVYGLTCYIGFSMEIMRAAFSIVICLYAYDYIMNKKWLKGYFLIFIAFLFHAQTILMPILPILFFFRLNKKYIFIIVVLFLIGYYIKGFIGEYIELINLGDIGQRASNYVESDDYGVQGGNLNFYIVNIFPDIIYSLFSLYYIKKVSPYSPIIKLEPLLLIGVLFLVIQMNIQIAYRYVDYFRLYFAFFYAEAIIEIIKNVPKVNRFLGFVRAFVIFLPFFILLGYSYYIRLYTIYPYSSVIELSVDNERESKYMKSGRPRANFNEF